MMLRRHAGDVPFIIISDRDDPQEIAAAVAAETRGFLPTGIDANLACEALSFILHGGSYFPQPAILQLQRQSARTRSQEDGQRLHYRSDGSGLKSDCNGHRTKNKLTGREEEVLERVRFGEPNKLIARELGMSEATVKVYIGQLMRKFGAANRTQLAVVGNEVAPDRDVLREGLVEQKSATSSELKKSDGSRTNIAFDNTLTGRRH